MSTPLPVSSAIDIFMRSTNSIFEFANGTFKTTITIAANGKTTFDNTSGEDFTISGNGFAFARFSYGGMLLIGSGAASYSVSGGVYAAGSPRYFCADGVSGLGSPAANQASLVANGADVFTATTTKNVSAVPIQLKSYTVASLPSAAPAGQIIYVSDASTAPCIAFSNGTNWKRCDNAGTTVS